MAGNVKKDDRKEVTVPQLHRNCDDGDKEDSDHETCTNSQQNPIEIREKCKDTIDKIENLPKTLASSSLSTGLTSSLPSRKHKTVKKIDLGAAANYGMRTLNDALDNDFDPRAEIYTEIKSNSNIGEFGDFTSAFKSPSDPASISTDNEFADFTSAFESNLVILQSTQSQEQSQISLLGATIPNTGYSNIISSAVTQGDISFKSNELSNLLTQSTDDQQHQLQSNINNSNNNLTMTNADLLSNFTGFDATHSPLANEKNLNNTHLFNSDPIVPSNDSAQNAPKLQASEQLLAALQAISGNKSQSNFRKLRSFILEYKKFLPGPLTPQKFIGLDLEDHLDIILYSQILESIVNLFDENWPMINGTIDEIVLNLFVIDGANFHMLNESLMILTQALEKAMTEVNIRCYSLILKKLIKSDALLSAIILSSRGNENNNNFSKYIEEDIWQNVIQIILSISNRVANKMKKNLLKSFEIQNLTYTLTFHIARAIYFLNTAENISHVQINMSVLSALTSKMFLLFNSEHLIFFVEIILEWSKSNENNILITIQNILFNIDCRSRENIAIQFLRHSKFNFEIFKNFTRDKNWYFIFTTRIPLMRLYDEENLIKNLILYLFDVQNSYNRILVELVLKLLYIWADKSALNHTSFDQHLYVTKLIILSLKCMKKNLTTIECKKIQKFVFSGISNHLESTEVRVRAVGMITGEIILDIITDVSSVGNLKFEYDGLTKEANKVVQSLRTLDFLDNNKVHITKNIDLSIDGIEFPNKGNKKVYQLGVKCGILKKKEYKGLTQKIENKKSVSKEKELLSTLPGNSMVNQQELDSDDEFLSYDMSNDSRQTNKMKPLFLRDLKNYLVHEKFDNKDNPYLFSDIIKLSEELISDQLVNDDSKFACELLEIFINLQEKSPVENFEIFIFKICSTIVTVHPKDTAKYICKEFHAELSKYTVQQRLLMLNILCEAATRLSSLKSEEKVTKFKTPEKKKKASNKCLSLSIETDKSKKFYTQYNDDLDDCLVPSIAYFDWHKVVEKRIISKTRRFSQETKLLKSTLNKFSNVVTYFFYPLLHGFDLTTQCFLYDFPKNYKDCQSLLLIRFLETLATILIAAQNCLEITKMAKEVLDLVWTLKYHSEGRVRLAVMKCIASVLISIPEYNITGDLASDLMEIREWLFDLIQDNLKGDSDKNCRELGRQVLRLLDSVLQGLYKIL